MIGTRVNKGKGMFPWLQQTFLGEEDCVTSPKNVCVKGYLLGADHLALEGGGGGGWRGGVFLVSKFFFFPSNLVGRIFLSLLNALQDIFFSPHFSAGLFFTQKSVVFILHCGYCSNSSNMELQSLQM